MDYVAVLDGVAKLGPAVAAVLAIALICYFLIQVINKVLGMFEKFGTNMEAHTKSMLQMGSAVEKMGDNIESNTHATMKMVALLERDSMKK